MLHQVYFTVVGPQKISKKMGGNMLIILTSTSVTVMQSLTQRSHRNVTRLTTIKQHCFIE